MIAEALSVGTPVLISDQTPWRKLAAVGLGHDLPLAEPGAFVRVIESAAKLTPAQRQQQRVQTHAAMRQRWMNSQDLADNRAMFNRALGKDE